MDSFVTVLPFSRTSSATPRSTPRRGPSDEQDRVVLDDDVMTDGRHSTTTPPYSFEDFEPRERSEVACRVFNCFLAVVMLIFNRAG